jgi:small ligand-binding sensory domain FIST
MLARIREATNHALLIGCSGQAIIGMATELEDVPALSLLALALPGVRLHTVRLSPTIVEDCPTPAAWREEMGATLDEVNAWLLFADPQMDIEPCLEGLGNAYSQCPLLGGMASASAPRFRECRLFLNGEVLSGGGVALAIGGDVTILPLVSQGCEPIGEPWTITGVHDTLVQTISNRPAYEMLAETFRDLPETTRKRAQHNLLVGLAANEYLDTFERGNFLIRPILGKPRGTEALAIGANPRLGQTIQFQMRDAEAADLDLSALLEQARTTLGTRTPIAGILCSCNGRGLGMFGESHHDARAINRHLGNIPLVGLFCNGEIGPIGMKPFLHSFTASLALFVHKK